MSFESIDPATGETFATFPEWSGEQVDAALQQAHVASGEWAKRPMQERTQLMHKAAEVLRARKEELAGLITREMGKIWKESVGEVEKCAWVCDYYAEHGPRYLADEPVETDATRSLVVYQPLGTVFAVMPWNFPFWQVFRFAAPALVAGNTGVLKHSSNVPQCAMGIESVFKDAGFPEGAFVNLLIGSRRVSDVIADGRIKAVTLTGSVAAGRSVASAAGQNLKKSVLELGGSDAFVVLEDCDLDQTVKTAVLARFLNAGQSCIAAKRFIVVEAIADSFVERFKAGVEALRTGHPKDPETTLGPMARGDLRDEVHEQVVESLNAGAVAVTGCEPVPGPGYFYRPSILDHVAKGQRVYDEEVFGPVALVIRVRDEQEAIRVANGTCFGLGSSVWTRDLQRGERVARRLEAGSAFVNGMVKSDPRLPFGGVKCSGYGRELSYQGIREFVNIKTLWMSEGGTEISHVE